MNLLNSISSYEEYIYSLPNHHPEIKISTLVLKRYGHSLGEVSGTIFFKDNVKLSMRELIDFHEGIIKTYSYEVSVNGEKQYWYDPQPHPNIPSLQATHPHHKHLPPEIKHNRHPAANISFYKENISFIITEIIENYFSN
ncbi:hypothetical protein JW964_03580 [candidate division KSB1 bacterium]|nr:hypothetical protein [candidate division KSB1 bacterium]